mgnify:CR=1 FL=1
MAKETQEGITVKKSENFSEWYTQLITKSELVDYTAVSGCIAYRPQCYAIWERMHQVVDRKLKELGVKKGDKIDIELNNRQRISGFGICKGSKPFKEEQIDHEI